MGEPPSSTAAADPSIGHAPVVIGADEQDAVAIDVARWVALAEAVLTAEGQWGELTLTFVDAAEIAALNVEHMGVDGPTDVLSFPLDVGRRRDAARCPSSSATSSCARRSRATRRPGTPARSTTSWPCSSSTACSTSSATTTPRDDDTALMRRRELDLLEAHHWHGPAPAGFRQAHS